ncbi:DUF4386 domain-containing protein [Candidatus Neomarinimicrobiota bacterium]
MKKFDSNTKIARLAGFFYLILAITGIFSFFVKEKLVVYGDPQVTVTNILSSESLFIFSIISELIMATSWILIAVTLYALFKKVNNNIAVLMVSLVLVGGAIIYINVISQIATLTIIKNTTGYLSTFNTSQLYSLAMLFLEISRESVYANYIFMGLWMFPFAFFVFKSEFFPKTISKIWGILLIVGGLGYIVDFITYFLSPNIFMNLTSFVFLGDLFSIIWLLIKGANTPKLNIE